MLPSEFLRLYGTVVIRAGIVLNLAPGEFFRQIPDEHRYLLNIFCRSGAVSIWWDSGDGPPNLHHFELVAGQTKEIVHALHGAWANTGYTIQSTALGSELNIVEGFMRPDNFERRKVADSGKTNKPDRRRGRSAN